MSKQISVTERDRSRNRPAATYVSMTNKAGEEVRIAVDDQTDPETLSAQIAEHKANGFMLPGASPQTAPERPSTGSSAQATGS